MDRFAVGQSVRIKYAPKHPQLEGLIGTVLELRRVRLTQSNKEIYGYLVRANNQPWVAAEETLEPLVDDGFTRDAYDGWQKTEWNPRDWQPWAIRKRSG